jgi:hypothetical protein
MVNIRAPADLLDRWDIGTSEHNKADVRTSAWTCGHIADLTRAGFSYMVATTEFESVADGSFPLLNPWSRIPRSFEVPDRVED